MNDRLKKGFSLFEIVISIVLIGLITSISVPSFKNYHEKLSLKEEEISIVSLYEKTLSFLHKAKPTIFNKDKMIAIYYPIFMSVSADQELSDLFSISNFSDFLDFWWVNCGDDSKKIASYEYINAEYVNNEFGKGCLKVCFDDDTSIIFSVFISYDSVQKILYAEFETMSFYNINGFLIKEYQM